MKPVLALLVYPACGSGDSRGVDSECPAQVWYRDKDGDGFGGALMATSGTCREPADVAELGGDCDDDDSSIHPGAQELLCNGVDEDCTGSDACDVSFDDAGAAWRGSTDWYLGTMETAVVGSRVAVVAISESDHGQYGVLLSQALPRGDLDLTPVLVPEEPNLHDVVALGRHSLGVAGDSVSSWILDDQGALELGLEYRAADRERGGDFLTAGNLVGDETLDLAFLSYDDNGYDWIVIDGSRQGEISEPDATIFVHTVMDLSADAGDGDGDGYSELILDGWAPEDLNVFRGPIPPYQNSSEADFRYVGEGWVQTRGGADVDGDGLSDLLVWGDVGWDPDEPVGTRAVRLDQDGTADYRDAFVQIPGVGAWGCGDTDGDGFEDLLAMSEDSWYLLRGPLEGTVDFTGGLHVREDASRVQPWGPPSCGDIDEDGVADFLIGSEVVEEEGSEALIELGLFYGISLW